MESFYVKAGKYILGDPCYCFPHDGPYQNKWSELLDNNAGLPDLCAFVPIDGIRYKVMAFDTLYGDGEYTSNHGHSFPVDAGLIGLVPYDLAVKLGRLDETINDDLSIVVEFKDVYTICYKNKDGTLVFGDISIFTGYDDEEDEEAELCYRHDDEFLMDEA